GAVCSVVPSVRRAPDRHSTARIPRPGAVLECPPSERTLGEFQTYDNAVRSHSSLAGPSPPTFAMNARLRPPTRIMSAGAPIVGGLSSFQSPPDANSRPTGIRLDIGRATHWL